MSVQAPTPREVALGVDVAVNAARRLLGSDSVLPWWDRYVALGLLASSFERLKVSSEASQAEAAQTPPVLDAMKAARGDIVAELGEEFVTLSASAAPWIGCVVDAVHDIALNLHAEVSPMPTLLVGIAGALAQDLLGAPGGTPEGIARVGGFYDRVCALSATLTRIVARGTPSIGMGDGAAQPITAARPMGGVS